MTMTGIVMTLMTPLMTTIDIYDSRCLPTWVATITGHGQSLLVAEPSPLSIASNAAGV